MAAPGPLMRDPSHVMSYLDDTLALWDYRRRVEELYTEIRRIGAGEEAWNLWRETRDELFGTHPQSALTEAQQAVFTGLPYFPYDPSWRFLAEVAPVPGDDVRLSHSGAGSSPFKRFGVVRFSHQGNDFELTLYWLNTYGGGVFLPFRDGTRGKETDGGGRYLLDTVKGADLGREGRKLVLDFNFAYHPSCVHDSRWSCPLAPPENNLDHPIRVGERLPKHG